MSPGTGILTEKDKSDPIPTGPCAASMSSLPLFLKNQQAFNLHPGEQSKETDKCIGMSKDYIKHLAACPFQGPF